jgi:drug/metabolite transporter (DMT)-like permease
LIYVNSIAYWIERPDWKKVWKEWKILLLMAILGIIGYNFLLYEALRFTSPMNAALVNSMNPALIFLFSSYFLKERISLRSGIGLFVSLVGVLLVLTKGQLWQIFSIDYNLVDLLMLLAILVWIIYSMIGRKMKGIPPISATAVSAVLRLFILLPFLLASDIHYPLSKQATIGILYMGIFPSVGSFIFWNVAILQIDASRAGIYLNLIAVFTAILSLLLGTAVTFVQILGGLFVFIGVYLTSQTGKKKPIISPLQEQKVSHVKSNV